MRSVRALMRTTVDTFVGEYTATIEAQTEQPGATTGWPAMSCASPVGTILVAASLIIREDVQHDLSGGAHRKHDSAERGAS